MPTTGPAWNTQVVVVEKTEPFWSSRQMSRYTCTSGAPTRPATTAFTLTMTPRSKGPSNRPTTR